VRQSESKQIAAIVVNARNGRIEDPVEGDKTVVIDLTVRFDNAALEEEFTCHFD